MDIKSILAILAAFIGVFAFVPYIKDIFLFKTRPHTYTWLIWGITQCTAIAGLLYGGGGGIASLWLATSTLLVILVFLFSLKYGTNNITGFDTIVLIAALSAIFIWWQLDRPLLAVLMVSLIDTLGYIPSFRKTFVDPWSETVVSWIAFTIADILSIIALVEYNLLTVTYIASIILANLILITIIFTRRLLIPFQD